MLYPVQMDLWLRVKITAVAVFIIGLLSSAIVFVPLAFILWGYEAGFAAIFVELVMFAKLCRWP